MSILIEYPLRFVVESVIDDLYFVVASVNEPDLRRVTSMLDPTIFPCGTFKSLRFENVSIKTETAQFC